MCEKRTGRKGAWNGVYQARIAYNYTGTGFTVVVLVVVLIMQKCHTDIQSSICGLNMRRQGK